MYAKVVGNGELDRIFTIAWRLWHRRNKHIFSSEHIPPMEAADHALSLLTDDKNNNAAALKPSLKTKTWIAPSIGMLKLNVDGAIFAELQQAGVGCVLRHEKGEVLMAATNPIQCFNTPLEIEFLALFRGLQLCLPMGVRVPNPKLIVESDSSVAERALQKREKLLMHSTVRLSGRF